MVADGFWKTARLADFVANVSAIRGRFACWGPYHSPEPGEPLEPFVEALIVIICSSAVSLREGGRSPTVIGFVRGVVTRAEIRVTRR